VIDVKEMFLQMGVLRRAVGRRRNVLIA